MMRVEKVTRREKFLLGSKQFNGIKVILQL